MSKIIKTQNKAKKIVQFIGETILIAPMFILGFYIVYQIVTKLI